MVRVCEIASFRAASRAIIELSSEIELVARNEASAIFSPLGAAPGSRAHSENTGNTSAERR